MSAKRIKQSLFIPFACLFLNVHAGEITLFNYLNPGETKAVSGFEYLPRPEANKPGMIKDFRIFITTTPY